MPKDKTEHLKTEFGFDMVQVAKNRYASQQYHDFIGFKVSKPLLERVVPVVYGLELKDVIAHEDLAIGSYRFSISRLIPEMTQVALQTHKKEIMQEHPDFAKKKFLYRLSRSDYEKEWGKDYTKPGIGARILAIFFRIVPKIGPFKGLGFNHPTPQTEDMYFKSINATVDQYRAFLRAEGTNSLQLANCDLDSGKATQPGEYSLADQAYAKLLQRLSETQIRGYDCPTCAPIFSISIPVPRPRSAQKRSHQKIEPEKDQVDSKHVQTELDQLRAMTPTAAADRPHTDRAPAAQPAGDMQLPANKIVRRTAQRRFRR